MKREILLPKDDLPPKWQFLDAVVVLTVFERKDRLENAYRELENMGLLGCCYVLQTETDTQAARGCYESHRFAAKYSLLKKWKRTLILEDKFTVRENNILPKLKKATNSLPKGWFLLKIGHIPVFPIYDFKRKIWKGRALTCTAQVISSDFAEWIPEWKFIEGGFWHHIKRLGPKKLDGFLMEQIPDKTYLTIPSLVFVSPGIGRSPRTQVCFQYLFPLVYILAIVYVIFRLLHTKALVKRVLRTSVGIVTSRK